MPQAAATGAMLTCSFGMAPATLNALPLARVMVEGKAAADISTAIPVANIPPFGMCTSISNPTVAAATAAALGVLTPAPCVPVTAAWIPGAPKTLLGGKPALGTGSTCQCAFGGVIQIGFAGTTKTVVN